MAFGIHSTSASPPARPALSGDASGASLAQAWRRLRRWIAGCRQRQSLAELDDRFLRDIGLIRERDIGMSRDAAARDPEKLLWRS